ncbi:MAG: hypothetical protein HC834_09545 [Rhodospirillales bacterium]|nr:hypothetical protein [Rhodospirillales bacterium]
MGIDANQIEIIGSLSPLIVPISAFCVSPFMGVCHTKPSFKANPSEVAYTISFPANKLYEKNNIKQETKTFNNAKVNIPYFNIEMEKVWGATAMILNEFREAIPSGLLKQY